MSGTASKSSITAWLFRQCRGLLAPLSAATVFGILNAAVGVAVLIVAVVAVIRAVSGVAPVGALVAIITLSVAKAAFRYLEQYIGHRVAFSALARLRVVFFRAITPQAPALTASARSSELTGIATRDIDRVEVFFAHTIPPAIIAIVVPGAFITWTAVALSPLLALPIALAWLLSVAVVPWTTWRLTARRTIAAAAGTASYAQVLSEQLQGAREVQQLAAEDASSAVRDAAGDRALRDALVVARARAIRKAVVDALQLAAHLAVVAIGIANGLGGIVVAVALAVSIGIARPSRAVDGFAADLSAALAAARRLRAAMERPPAVTNPEPAADRVASDGAESSADHGTPAEPTPRATARTIGRAEEATRAASAQPANTSQSDGGITERVATGAPLITIDSASLSIDGHRVLSPVRWSIARDSHTAVVGVSGSGKSSLLSLLLRVRDPDDGAITLDGSDLRDLQLSDIRRRVAITTQRPEFFSGTLRDALNLRAPDVDDATLMRAAHIAVLDDWIDSLPAGLDTRIRQGGRTLSGGQRQRLALARTIVAPPELLILDEATGQLDGATEAELRTRLMRWAREHSVGVLNVTHRVEQVLDAAHVLVLDDGAVVEEGAPRELAASNGPFARLLARRADP